MGTALVCVLAVGIASARVVTFRNDVPRLDVNGDIIDCHSGMILAVNGVWCSVDVVIRLCITGVACTRGGTYLMYGERYTNSTGFGPSPPLLFPKIVVYTSRDMMAWTYRGPVVRTVAASVCAVRLCGAWLLCLKHWCGARLCECVCMCAYYVCCLCACVCVAASVYAVRACVHITYVACMCARVRARVSE